MHVLEISKHDKTFFMLNLLFDKSLDSKFEYFAASFVETKKTMVVTNSVIRKVLEYSHLKNFRRGKQEELQSMEQCLRKCLEALEAARKAMSLKSYGDTNWTFSSEN